MDQKKIATCVDVMIKVANYEYIHVTKYAEKNISYENKQEMVSREDELSKDLVGDVIRTLRDIPDQLGQGKAQEAEVEEKIKTRIPEWLGSDPEPNIANNMVNNTVDTVANMAKKNNEKAESEIEAKVEAKKEKTEMESDIVEDLFDDSDKKSVESPKAYHITDGKEPLSDLFDKPPEESKTDENKPKSTEKDDLDDLFESDEELFDKK